ncbi:MAG: hypothetical protein KDI38_21635 [Calditrichaeota bacterium]|nr:hypothetical protein [Calditrichota bacterium]MCB0316914.1 hypothetical protein [Calditrichota bacterium]
MVQAKFSLEASQIDFLNLYKEYGFKDKSALIRAAIDRLKKDLEMQKISQSAELYAKLYEEDFETRDLTESALSGWPE